MAVENANGALRDAVVDELRRMILAGEFEAGSRMKEEAAAERLGVSRLPVREAFRRLEAEGLLQAIPRRGVTVTPPDDQELKVMHAARVELELIAVELAVKRQDAEAKDALREWLSSGTAAAKNGDAEALERLNQEIHDLLCNASRSTYLAGLLRPVRNRVHHLHGGWYQAGDQSWTEHSRIVRAVLRKDADAAIRLMRSHLESLHS